MTSDSLIDSVPKEIKRLDEAVVNRIAAGEVVQRPANAVKELLENSLDAGATTVTITCKEGGIKSLQVQDDGCGIRKEDLPILCERHTTSKLRKFEDLSSISTLGFRGEALASISYISHVTVTTLTAQGSTTDHHGWRATFKDGIMTPPTPRPAAATKGTIILAEDLFYNVPLRKKALRSASEEYNAILDVVGKYAVYKAGAAISVKKLGDAKSDLSTPAGGSRLDAIRGVYGAVTARNCLPLTFDTDNTENNNSSNEILKCSIQGYITGADYVGRKTQLVLFINGRSVDFPPLKRCIEATYMALLPKTSKPFVFLDVTMPSQHVDVNIHPTKKEVAFLFQEEFVDAVRTAVEAVLLASNAQRTYKQTVLPGASVPPLPFGAEDITSNKNEINNNNNTKQPGYYRPDKLVRTDAQAQTLDAFVAVTGSIVGNNNNNIKNNIDNNNNNSIDDDHGARKDDGVIDLITVPKRRKGHAPQGTADPGNMQFLPTAMEITMASREPKQQEQQNNVTTQIMPVRHKLNPTQPSGLASVEQLLAAAEATPHQGIIDILKNSTFVGLADSHRMLLQSGTRLYLVDLTPLTRDMFYQQVLRRFGQAPKVTLSQPLCALDLARIALKAEESVGRWVDDGSVDNNKEEIAQLLSQLMVKKSGILEDCFSITVDTEQGNLTSLPQLIEQYHPAPQFLPQFILDLGQKVDWQEENACFEGVAWALADLYSLHTDHDMDEWLNKITDDYSDTVSLSLEREKKRREWEAAHVLLPALRLFLKPHAERAGDGTIIELTRLEHLYRVFERC